MDGWGGSASSSDPGPGASSRTGLLVPLSGRGIATAGGTSSAATVLPVGRFCLVVWRDPGAKVMAVAVVSPAGGARRDSSTAASAAWVSATVLSTTGSFSAPHLRYSERKAEMLFRLWAHLAGKGGSSATGAAQMSAGRASARRAMARSDSVMALRVSGGRLSSSQAWSS